MEIKMKPKYFILDVDGVMTTGQFMYSKNGKIFKVFGPHDSDGLKLIRNKIDISFISADKRGFSISKKRIVEDMGYKLKLVSEENRYNYIKNNFGFDKVIYMGDGIFDAPLIKKAKYGISPKNARIEARKVSNYITPSKAAEGAVLDACLKINKVFFNKKIK